MDIERLKNLIEFEKLQQWKAAEALGCSVSCVERWCKRLGLHTQRTGPRNGPQHPEWKGGQKIVGGYKYIWDCNHPNRTKQNYVAEHRLVMERQLGRYLARHEVVHHIDGNRLNNHPDNLMVFQTNALHLRHELTGRVPNWTDEGLRRMRAGIERSSNARRGVAACDWKRSQDISHSESETELEVQEV